MLTPFTTICLSPNRFLALANSLAKEEGTILLFSGNASDLVHQSFLFFFPIEKISLGATPSAWEELTHAVEYNQNGSSIPQWAGFIGYEMGFYADPVDLPISRGTYPDLLFYRAGAVLRYDHNLQQGTLFIRRDKLDASQMRFVETIGSAPLPDFQKGEKPKLLFASDTIDSYTAKIEEAKNWILDGSAYQINLSRQWVFRGKQDPFFLFLELNRKNPAPFSAFLNCGHFAVVSSSPERFLKHKKGFLETRPIKGTAARGRGDEDEANLKKLIDSEKERSELLMITDLSRNDLGKISLPGSVEVPELFHTEAYANVFHLLSIVHARALPNLHPFDMLKAAFPGGSITGCPKLAAIKAIHALEKRRRGIYTGAIGYLAENGDFDFNIAIRTLVMVDDLIDLQLGGAITYDSDPKAEFEETLHKGATLFEVLQ